MTSSDPLVPALCTGVDLKRMPLSVEEAYVATRVDGRSNVDDIAKVLGKDSKETERILQRLAELGVITLGAKRSVAPPGSSRPTATSPEKPAGPDFGDFNFESDLMSEMCDLDEPTRKRVMFAYSKLDGRSLYDVLGVNRRSDPKEIKKAYFDRSKEWHPDRFKRYKNLGSFRKRIEEIYRAIYEAYRLLMDPEKREAYDATLNYEPEPDEIEAILKEQIEQERSTRRDLEKKDRRLKNNPILQRFERAKEFYDTAVALEAEGKIGDAMRAAQMATTYDERRVEYKQLFERLRDAAADDRIAPLLKRGRHFESMVHWDEAIEMYEEAVRIAPNQGECRLRLAYAFLHANRPNDEIMPHAQKAAMLCPDEAEAHYVLGRCYEAEGNDKSAKRHYERATELRPNYQEAKKRLKRLKWGF